MKEMINKAQHGFAGLPVVGFDMGSAEGDYTGELTLMLNAARNEERGNRAQVFAARLEAIFSRRRRYRCFEPAISFRS